MPGDNKYVSSSRQNRDRCRNGKEIARMVRFNLMWTNAIDRPRSGKNSNRNIVTGLKTYSPIERNIGGKTARSGDADIKKRPPFPEKAGPFFLVGPFRRFRPFPMRGVLPSATPLPEKSAYRFYWPERDSHSSRASGVRRYASVQPLKIGHFETVLFGSISDCSDESITFPR